MDGEEDIAEADARGARAARLFLGKLGLPTDASRQRRYFDATGLPVDADAPEIRRDIAPIGGAVGVLADKLGLPREREGDDLRLADAVLEAWDKIVDDDLRDKLEPEKFVANMLYVFARNNTELFEIRRTRIRSLEAKARKFAVFAKLRQIRLKVK